MAFSTRVGGVSGGDFASLNLGIRTADNATNVAANRARLCEALGADAGGLALNWQQHGTRVRRAADPARPLSRADGLVSDEPGRPLLVLAADCLPIALARSDGERPALAVLHAGWRGLLAGIVAAGAAALAPGRVAACLGPCIGPCCYDVGPDVAIRYRAAYGADVVRGGRLDLPLAAERALRAAGVRAVEHIDLCTACRSDLFFSHRRDRGRTGRQGLLGLVA